MRKPESPPPAEQEQDEATRFDRLMQALFRVDKRDVPKHQPTKRTPVDRAR
jgi:hypothetical protein